MDNIDEATASFPQGAVVAFPISDRHRIQSTVYAARIVRRNTATATVDLHLNPDRVRYCAIWDTGAAYTVIVPKVVQEAELIQSGFRMSAGIDGAVTRRPRFAVAIVMRTTGGIFCHLTNATRLERDDQLGGPDILIGMDVMAQGTTVINFGGSTPQFMFVPILGSAGTSFHFELPDDIRRNFK